MFSGAWVVARRRHDPMMLIPGAYLLSRFKLNEAEHAVVCAELDARREMNSLSAPNESSDPVPST